MMTRLQPVFKNGDTGNRHRYRKGLCGCQEKVCSQGVL